MTGALVLAEPGSGGVLPVKLGSVFDSVKDLKNRLTGKIQHDLDQWIYLLLAEMPGSVAHGIFKNLILKKNLFSKKNLFLIKKSFFLKKNRLLNRFLKKNNFFIFKPFLLPGYSWVPSISSNLVQPFGQLKLIYILPPFTRAWY